MARGGRHRLLQNATLAALSFAATLGLLELGVRLFVGPVPPRNLTRVPESIRAASPSPDIPYLLARDAEAVQDFGSNPRGYFDAGGTLRYRTNSLGFRDREFAREKAPGRFRILGIGDSFTFGTGVRLEDTYLARLQALLDAGGAAGHYEVLNLGVMGFDTAHEVALLREVGLAFSPDLVILCYTLNDAQPVAPRSQRPPAPRPGARTPSLLLAHVFARLENRRLRQRAIANAHAHHRPGAPGWRRVQRALVEARALAREHDFALALMIFPVMWELGDDYPYRDIHETVAAAAARLGLPVLDLAPAFRGEDGVSLWVHPSNQHPNERAHAIAARALHAWLVETRLLDR